MNISIPKFLYTNDLLYFMRDQISFGVECFNDMSEKDQEKISQLIIDSCGTDALDILDLDECDLPFGVHSKERILHKIYKKFYYHLDNLFEEIMDDNKEESNRNNGLIPFINRQNGETEWKLSWLVT